MSALPETAQGLSMPRDDPVVVLGMHHSGTTVLARILSACGVFMHADMPHHESTFFTHEVNEALILGGETRWADLPILPVAKVLDRLDAVREHIARKALPQYRASGYVGGAWGFKDPRTCLTLPLFLEIFPLARVVHIVRDAPAVARSLSKSSKQGVGVRPDPAFWTALRAEYVARARQYGSRHHSYHEIRYERLCVDPVGEIRFLLNSLKIQATRRDVHAATALVRPAGGLLSRLTQRVRRYVVLCRDPLSRESRPSRDGRPRR